MLVPPNNLDFDLVWYRRRTIDGIVENLGTGFVLLNNEDQKYQVFTQLDYEVFSEEMQGEYWCQAQVNNSNGQYLLTNKSTVVTVLRPEDYPDALDICDVVVSLVESCAISLDAPIPTAAIIHSDTQQDPTTTKSAMSAVTMPSKSG